MKTNRLLLAMTFISVLLFGTSLYGQQEVDPTWYNPWPAQNKVTAQVVRPQVARRKNQPQNQAKIVSGLTEQHAGKLRVTRVVSRRSEP